MLLDGYIRVSQVAGRGGPTFISPIAQRDEIERWAARHGALIGHVFEELDESGGRSDRPMLLEAIRRVESHESDGVVVAYLSRFGRSLIDALVAVRRITDAGGTFVSVQEGLDLSTDTGRLMLRMLFSIAEWERDRTRAFFADACERAVARGVPAGQAAFGYRRKAHGPLEVDPEFGPVVVELFRRRACGVSTAELRRWLIATGVLREKGRRYWYVRDVDRLFGRRVYRGEIRYGGFVNLQAHEPLVSEDTWQLAQTKNLRVPAQRSADPALLRGILRCAGCQQRLQMGATLAGSSEESRTYGCGSRDSCQARAFIADVTVEPYMEELFWQELPRAQRARGLPRVRRLEADLARREEELDAYRDNTRLPRTLGRERFADGVEVRVRRVEQARLGLSRARIATDAPALPPPAELAKQWPSMTVNERRAALAEVIDCVFVSKRGWAIEDRLFVCLRGRGPRPVTDAPKRRTPVEPFNPGSCPSGARLRQRKPQVTTPELRRELAAFLEGHTSWPPFRYFQTHGKAALYAEAKRNRGPRHWASQLGLTYERPRAMRAWPDDRIRTELGQYLEGKTCWPTWAEFKADRKWKLRVAIRWNGGPERWADETGVKLKIRRRLPDPQPYADMRDTVRQLAGDSAIWPTQDQFHAAGLSQLESVIRRLGLRPRLLADLNLASPSQRRYEPRRWTDARIREALDQLLDGRDTWPSQEDFKESGLGGLYARLQHAPLRQWREQYGFESGRRGHAARRLRRAEPGRSRA